MGVGVGGRLIFLGFTGFRPALRDGPIQAAVQTLMVLHMQIKWWSALFAYDERGGRVRASPGESGPIFSVLARP